MQVIPITNLYQNYTSTGSYFKRMQTFDLRTKIVSVQTQGGLFRLLTWTLLTSVLTGIDTSHYVRAY